MSEKPGSVEAGATTSAPVVLGTAGVGGEGTVGGLEGRGGTSGVAGPGGGGAPTYSGSNPATCSNCLAICAPHASCQRRPTASVCARSFEAMCVGFQVCCVLSPSTLHGLARACHDHWHETLERRKLQACRSLPRPGGRNPATVQCCRQGGNIRRQARSTTSNSAHARTCIEHCCELPGTYRGIVEGVVKD